MKVSITGASNFVNRMFEACGNYQWAREFLRNSLEAQATKVEFGIEWQAVEVLGVYRRTIVDDGIGMSPEELMSFFSTLGIGSKSIGGVHDNFGVGAKIAALPWNPEGLVVISYYNGHASMIQIVLNPDTYEYELVEFATPRGRTCVLDPSDQRIDWGDGINWNLVAPDWARQHGTTVVLLGSEEYPDTVLGNIRAEERDIKGLSVYLNTRFWDLSHVEIRVAELRSEKKNSWPTSREDKDNARRPNNRRIMGALHYIAKVESADGKMSHSSSMLIDDDRVKLEWYLWEGERPAIHSYAKKGGYLAVRYKDELFEISSAKTTFRAFGVVESKVQQNLTIILEPDLYEPLASPWGIHPDQSRNRLIFTGNGEKGVAVPLSDWGLDFSENMPEAILAAIRKARGEAQGSIEDDEYRRRLQDRFGSRWTIRRPASVADDQQEAAVGDLTDEKINVPEEKRVASRRTRRRSSKIVHQVRFIGTDGTTSKTTDIDSAVDIPKYRYSPKDDFDKDWHLATWSPHDPDGPTVLLNQDAPVLIEAIKYHQDQYPDVYAEDIQRTVMSVYGEIAVAKIAHSQKLAARVSEQELDNEYRSEKALTIALMGLLAEETVIAQRLGKFGRKKSAA